MKFLWQKSDAATLSVVDGVNPGKLLYKLRRPALHAVRANLCIFQSVYFIFLLLDLCGKENIFLEF